MQVYTALAGTTICPFFIILCASAVLLLPGIIKPLRGLQGYISICISLISLFCLRFTGKSISLFNNAFIIDDKSVIIWFVILFFLIVTLFVSINNKENNYGGKYYFCLLTSSAFLMLAVTSVNLISAFICLEIAGMCTYKLTSIYKNVHMVKIVKKFRKISIFYSIISFISLIILGFSYDSLNTNSLYYYGMPGAMATMAFIMFAVSVMFKAGALPFNLIFAGVCDVVSLPVLSYIATVSRIGAIFVLYKIFTIFHYGVVFNLFFVIAIATALFGELFALLQNNLKKLFAYTAVAHTGYCLTAYMGGEYAMSLLIASMPLYFASLFGICAVLSDLKHYEKSLFTGALNGFANQNPLAGLCMGIFLFTIAGIPVLPGFILKFNIAASVMKTGYMLPALFSVFASLISSFYALRIISAMYIEESSYKELKISSSGKIVVYMMAIILVLSTVFLSHMLNYISGL